MVYKKDTTLGQTREFDAQVEDGEGDRWQKNGGSALAEVERDGSVQLPAAAAARLRHVQELRGPFPCRIHGRQWRRYVGKGGVLRAQGGGRRRRQEEVSLLLRRSPGHVSALPPAAARAARKIRDAAKTD